MLLNFRFNFAFLLHWNLQINKFGLIWLVELYTGELIGSLLFAEWTLLLALQIRYPPQDNDGAGPSVGFIFGDFLIRPFDISPQAQDSLLPTYEVKYFNLLGVSSNAHSGFSLRDRIDALLAARPIKALFDQLPNGTAIRQFFQLLQAKSSRECIRLITTLALCMLRVCSHRVFASLYDQSNFSLKFALPHDFFAGLLRIVPMPHRTSICAIQINFQNGSTLLRSILVPTLAIAQHLEKLTSTTAQPAFIAEIIGSVKQLLNHSVLSVFQFHGRHTLDVYATACQLLPCRDGFSFLHYTTGDLVSEGQNRQYISLEEYIRLYPQGDPERSLYPWAAALDPEYLAQYGCEHLRWICVIMSAICYVCANCPLEMFWNNNVNDTRHCLQQDGTAHLWTEAVEVAKRLRQQVLKQQQQQQQNSAEMETRF